MDEIKCIADVGDLIIVKSHIKSLNYIHRITEFKSAGLVRTKCLSVPLPLRTHALVGGNYNIPITNVVGVKYAESKPWKRAQSPKLKIREIKNTSGIVRVSERFHEKMIEELDKFVSGTWGENGIWKKPWNYVVGCRKDMIIDNAIRIPDTNDGCTDRQRVPTDLTSNIMLHMAMQGYSTFGMAKLGNKALTQHDSTPHALAMQQKGREVFVIGYSRDADIQVMSCQVVNRGWGESYTFRYYTYTVMKNPSYASPISR